MINGFFRVVKCGDTFTVPSTKSESGQMQKKYILLQEMGGRYTNQYVATLLGNDAACNFYPGDWLAASLKAQVSEFNDKMYQDILVVDFHKFNN